jgi:hypothetical protein
MCLSATATRLLYENCALRSLHVPFTHTEETTGDELIPPQHGRRALAMAGSKRDAFSSDAFAAALLGALILGLLLLISP